MRMLCRSGHLAFYPRLPGEISHFISYYGTPLVAVSDYYTFPGIAAAKDYSLEGHPYLNLTASATFEGRPWEVFKANGFVYDLTSDSIRLSSAVQTTVKLPLVGNYYLSPYPVLPPGSLFTAGNRILSYDAEYDFDFYQLKVLRFDYE